MSLLIDLKENIFPILLSILGIVVAGIGAIASVRNIIKESHTSKKTKLEDVKSILSRREEIRKFNKFVQELEINTISVFIGFNWLEVEAILNRNIGVATINNLKVLSEKQLIALDGHKIYIPNRFYVVFNHFKDLKSIMLVIAFIISLVCLFIMLLYFHSNDFLYIKLLFLTLLLEFWMILNFDDLVIINMMRKESYMEKNNISISENFKEKLEKYETFKSEYYSMDKLKKLNADSNDQATPELVSDTN